MVAYHYDGRNGVRHVSGQENDSHYCYVVTYRRTDDCQTHAVKRRGTVISYIVTSRHFAKEGNVLAPCGNL